jgi:gelsolin
MIKQKTYDIADSNLALFGTEIEKNIKKAAAQGEKAWAETGKEPGLLIWRIEKFKVIKSKTAIGSFYENDSYIVLNTYKKENQLMYDIHFWLGRTTSQDEAGTAAYKTVELDDYLNDKPVQHREVQDHESPLFLSYFEKLGGIKILQGGIESGFHHVKPTEYVPRLLWVKGKKNVRVREVEKSYKSLNSGDVFILDMGLKLYQWNGSKSGVFERNKAGQMCRAIDSDRSGKPEVLVVEENSEDEEFWKALGGKGEIASSSSVPHDEEWEKSTDKKLFKLSDSEGSLKFTTVSKVAFSSLDTKDVFILDAGNHIFVWVGKSASVDEKKFSMRYAQEYTKTYQRPSFLPITMVSEGSESDQFKKAF